MSKFNKRIKSVPQNIWSLINQIDELIRISNFKQEYQQRYSISPPIEELAEAMCMPLRKLEDLLARGKSAVSIDAHFQDKDSEEGKNSLLDVLTNNIESPDARVMISERDDAIEEALHGLEAREAEILQEYFGLRNGDEKTLAKIAGKYGLTRERVRQIKETALQKLRHPARAEKLRPYADAELTTYL